jgi:two-component system phosphate regulon sensor histidine kinase PhoR
VSAAGWVLGAAAIAAVVAAAVAAVRLARSRRAAAALAAELEAERRRIAALEQSYRDLSANLAHEIGTPLSALRGYVETLHDGAHAPEDVPRFLEVCLRNVERLERLVRGVADLADVQRAGAAPALGPVAIAPVVDLAVATLRPRAAARRLSVAVGALDGAVTAETDHLLQVLVNLLDNAVKFTQPEGTVTVGLRRDDGRIGIAVSDDGPGIDPAALPRVTERFYRADAARTRNDVGGFGLGLAIAKHLAEAMTGTLTIESALGAGTTATVWLRPA